MSLNMSARQNTYLLETFLVEVHHTVRVHVQEAPVDVVSEAGVAVGLDDPLVRFQFHNIKKRGDNEKKKWRGGGGGGGYT